MSQADARWPAAAMALVCCGRCCRGWAAMLFAAHMAQHLLLIAVAAPLLVLGGVRIRMPPLAGWSLFVARLPVLALAGRLSMGGAAAR